MMENVLREEKWSMYAAQEVDFFLIIRESISFHGIFVRLFIAEPPARRLPRHNGAIPQI
jgi:hypothetical protein